MPFYLVLPFSFYLFAPVYIWWHPSLQTPPPLPTDAALFRYPQLHKCGRPSLPEQLWIFETGNNASSVDVEAIPLIQPVSLEDAHALPAFMVGAAGGGGVGLEQRDRSKQSRR